MLKSSQFITKFLLFLVVFTLSFNSLHAQDYYGSSYSQKAVSLGIVLSPNASWLRYGNRSFVDKELSIGYGYGLAADFAVSENYYFSTGFIINNLKSTSKIHADEPATTYEFQYVEVPFGLKLKSTQRYFRSYYGQFGFTGGVKIGSDKTVGQGEKEDLDAKLFRLALQIGGGIEWQLDHNLTFMTGLSYNNGITRIVGNDLGKPKNSYIALNFGIFF